MLTQKTHLLNKISDTGNWLITVAAGKYLVYQISNEHGQGRSIEISKKLYDELMHYACAPTIVRRIDIKTLLEVETISKTDQNTG